MLINEGKTKVVAAAKAGMSPKTAGKYLATDKLPSQMKKERNWRTRKDPFADVWDEVRQLLENDSGTEAGTIFNYLQDKYKDEFADGQLRSLQRRVKEWRALEGPSREVYFPQEHQPGVLCESDFTHMDELGVTLNGRPFEHLIYHFVLTYSNWETGTICYSESFESLSEGLQNALWRLGGVPAEHRTDRLSAAVNNLSNPAEFTRRYQGLLAHYQLVGQKIQAGKANENGDVEQSHHRFKRAVEQGLILRGNSDFSSREEYEEFLQEIFRRKNKSRQKRFNEERNKLKALPDSRLQDYKEFQVRVTKYSLLRIRSKRYSVPSRLIGSTVNVRLYADKLEVYYSGKLQVTLPRLRGEKKEFHVNYRHIIDSLVRKPGAFENVVYKECLFPTSRFRIAYDELIESHIKQKANREYLRILQLAAMESETRVDDALRHLIEEESSICFEKVRALVVVKQETSDYLDVQVARVDLSVYDELLEGVEVA